MPDGFDSQKRRDMAEADDDEATEPGGMGWTLTLSGTLLGGVGLPGNRR
jgi:hypothetical protein